MHLTPPCARSSSGFPKGSSDRLAREAGSDIRKFTAFSHVLALLYGHLSGASSLNEICDALRLHGPPEVTRIRGAVAPKRNTSPNLISPPYAL